MPAQQQNDVSEVDETRMTVIEHLAELRSRLIKASLALAAGTAVSLVFAWQIMGLLMAPAGQVTFIALTPPEKIVTYFKVALLAGLAISMPVIVYQILMFILPGLTREERRYLFFIAPGAAILFISGLLFAYFIMLPVGLRFLLNFGSDFIQNQWRISEYIGFVVPILLVMGLVFETPLVVFFLAKIGLISPDLLKRYRRHAIVLSAVLAAVITPTVDPFNMMLLMLPLIVLYELGILLARLA